MLLLLMKPSGPIDSAFDTGLVVCLRDDKDGESQVSFEGSLSLQLAEEGVHAIFSQPDTKRAFY